MLLPQIRNAAQAEQIALDIQTALQRAVRRRRMELAVERSIGIAVAPEHGTDVATLLQRADIAMYNAKESGDGGVEVYDAEHEPAQHPPPRRWPRSCGPRSTTAS